MSVSVVMSVFGYCLHATAKIQKNRYGGVTI